MKKSVLLNAPISRVVAQMGHTDGLCIADAGLPIPRDVERIDLAVRKGLPAFLEVLETVTSEMCVERALIATETRDQQPVFHNAILAHLSILEREQGKAIAVDYAEHVAFKQQTEACRAVVRTGECTPFANIILFAGVTF